MASIGYGYNKIGIQSLARDYALSVKEYTQQLAESTSRETLDRYYKKLGTILTKYNLQGKPERIFNVDEKGINTEHYPPKLVCDKATKPQAISSTRSATITIVAGGNALEIEPGCIPRSPEGMSESDWSNNQLFHDYMTTHFIKYASVPVGKDLEPTLLLYDGQKSHINLTLKEWAKKHNVVLFVLPAHTSHLTQPLDVGVFGPLKSMYNKESQLYMQRNPGINISKYQVAELTNKPYIRAMSPENLKSSFRKTEIYPFNNNIIDDSQVTPSVIYIEFVKMRKRQPVFQKILSRIP
ncbi:hypothetical protein KUTeg_006194 [Tegillarca granosa]|uniref:DDE-1 domain-containing protein n=1 Tax=Tegillarca granosa TaxID=220873 RepID=A0ABQ9FIS7_TEGGR|nr:hypothetical protein KUTeg_006194 [Tegillarca granosa]